MKIGDIIPGDILQAVDVNSAFYTISEQVIETPMKLDENFMFIGKRFRSHPIDPANTDWGYYDIMTGSGDIVLLTYAFRDCDTLLSLGLCKLPTPDV